MASRGSIRVATRAMLALGAVLWLGACGGDDDGGSESMAGSGGSSAGSGGSSAGSGGSGAGSGGASGSTSTGGGSGGSGGTGGLPFPMAMCDTSIPTTATCGGTMCPSSPLAMFTCQVPCCTADDECGTRNSTMGMTTGCAAGAQQDPSCPGYSGMAMGMQVDLPGCCTVDGICGAISSISGMCITSSMFLTDLMPGGPCGGDADGGL